jgi:hypothetical protein
MDRKIPSLIVFISLFLVVSSSAMAIEYGGVGIKPANPREEETKSESIFIHTVEPGQIIDEKMLVINNTSEETTLFIYSADSTPSTDGGFACKQISEAKTKTGNWIDIPVKEITLRPNSIEEIPFKITVPIDVEPGEHNGCVLAQGKKVEEKPGQGINLSIRTGIRVALTVKGEIIRSLLISSFEVNKKENYIILKPSVKNTGTVSVEANIEVFTKNILTRSELEKKGNKYTILRDDTASWNFELNKPFWGGFYESRARVNYNDGNIEKVLLAQPVRYFILPSNQAIIYIAIVILCPVLFFLFLVISKIRTSSTLKKWSPYTIKVGDTLKALADDRNINWKLIVKANKLKAPYDLKNGQEIKLPKREDK